MKSQAGVLMVLAGLLPALVVKQAAAEQVVTQRAADQASAGTAAGQLAFAGHPDKEETSTLRQRLLQMDALRSGSSTPFVEVEKQGRALLRQYTLPEQHAQIFFTLAEIYAQSDIRLHPERVTRYARLALASEHNPVQRGILYSYLGSAAEVDPTCLTFAQQRQQAAQVWLQGYEEFLPLHLPATAPKLPPVEKAVDNSMDLSQRKNVLKKHTEQTKARDKAERLAALVAERDIFVRQLTEVYAREPQANEQLTQLAARILEDKQATQVLLNQVLKK